MTDKYLHLKGSVNEDGTGQVDIPVKFTDTGSGLALPVSVVGGVTITQNAITSTTSYIATTTNGGGGYSSGDHITATLFWDASNLANPAFLIAAWYNWDTSAEIATPTMAHLTAVAEDALTDTQLRAAPVPVVDKNWTPFLLQTAGNHQIAMAGNALGSVHVLGGTAGTVKLYNHPSSATNLLFDLASTDNASFENLNMKFSNGIYAVLSANTTVLITAQSLS